MHAGVAPGQCFCSHSTSGSRRSGKLGFEQYPHAPYYPDFPQTEIPLAGLPFLSVIMTSYMLLKVFLGLRMQTSSEKGSQSLNIGGQIALKFRGTMLKNNIEMICLWLRPRTF